MVEERRARQEGPPLQCPRCGSHNTKFCYYNNYNTAQPRHFCRGCQRYWTHGGALRNIPAGGAGGRKRSRRNEKSPTSPGPSSKLPRLQTDHAPVIEGSVLSTSLNPMAPQMGLIPPPPQPFFYGGDQGIPGLGFSGPIPTLQLFNNPGVNVNGGFRGFHPFNPLIMPPLPLLHGLNMQQQVVINGDDLAGPGNGGNNVSPTGENVGEGNQDGHGDQGLFVNHLFTRFGNGGGEEARVTFNGGDTGASRNQPCQATSSAVATTSGVTPAKFM